MISLMVLGRLCLLSRILTSIKVVQIQGFCHSSLALPDISENGVPQSWPRFLIRHLRDVQKSVVECSQQCLEVSIRIVLVSCYKNGS